MWLVDWTSAGVWLVDWTSVSVWLVDWTSAGVWFVDWTATGMDKARGLWLRKRQRYLCGYHLIIMRIISS